ncbi:MAG: acetate--CoA ligase [Actinobacteria bacterium]|nr:acetate--CoA ligase [Actinomycetota bacterium]MBU1944781.1 acetate--CoA ligase [Actinomycetota bacterium]MBU2688872.1 acetate--CoA ligase [Actinomycetota bacterium]
MSQEASEGIVGALLPPEELSRNAYVKSMGEYRDLYRRSLDDPDGFWAEVAEQQLDWYRRWHTVLSWDPERKEARWFEGGVLNAAYNCLDRHLAAGRGERIAIHWDPDEPGEGRTLTYRQLHEEVCRFANVLRKYGVGKGDRVCIYLPMIPELPIAMLACARIGAVHVVVFGGFSSGALRDRILDSGSRTLVCCDAGRRCGKVIPLMRNADWALRDCPGVQNVFVVRRAGVAVEMKEGRDHWWDEELAAEDIEGDCPPEEMNAEDPLFILYTASSTGRPVGVLHTTGGYLVQASITHRWVFDVHDEDVWWCAADVGWVTGHSYLVYGPLVNGSSQVMFEGVATYPHPDRFWQICEKYRVSVLYTAPTVIRSLMKHGDKWTTTCDLSSLRVLGTVGEPVSPDVWLWYRNNIGGGRCPVLDTWWQTETGGILIAPLAGATPTKPGSSGFPFPGVVPVILRQDRTEADVDESGFLCIKQPWPGMMRTIYGNHKLFVETYYSLFPDAYLTGDGCRVDADGYYWLQGRVDNVINASGFRIGACEVESALAGHQFVSEAAVVGMPHAVKGQGIYAFVILKGEYEKLDSDEVRTDLLRYVGNRIGPIARPDVIQLAAALPRTRSGKVMRGILRNIAEGKTDRLADRETLADPGVVEQLIAGSKELLDKG